MGKSQDSMMMSLPPLKSLYLLFVCVLKWPLYLGVKKSLATPRLVSFRGFKSKFPTSIPAPFIWPVAPWPTTSLVFGTCELCKSYLWKQKLVSRGASTIVQPCNCRNCNRSWSKCPWAVRCFILKNGSS